MSEGVELLVISVGGEQNGPDRPDLVGRDFLHVIREDVGKVVPVFSTPETFREYVRLNLAEGAPGGHLDLMEAGDERTARALADEHFEGVAMSIPELRDYAESVGADAIMLDPLPGRPVKVWGVKA